MPSYNPLSTNLFVKFPRLKLVYDAGLLRKQTAGDCISVCGQIARAASGKEGMRFRKVGNGVPTVAEFLMAAQQGPLRLTGRGIKQSGSTYEKHHAVVITEVFKSSEAEKCADMAVVVDPDDTVPGNGFAFTVKIDELINEVKPEYLANDSPIPAYLPVLETVEESTSWCTIQ
ncbi:hypothetical protein [uncultured Alsobacter sp.]|uniref:hypothetical protein n=1 Tax=uncultured Alsobacter sp. TaxID=1748258 RepID=UPI0025CD741D|nr:hypothetical protein [uncultured Alsobacter sp.]